MRIFCVMAFCWTKLSTSSSASIGEQRPPFSPAASHKAAFHMSILQSALLENKKEGTIQHWICIGFCSKSRRKSNWCRAQLGGAQLPTDGDADSAAGGYVTDQGNAVTGGGPRDCAAPDGRRGEEKGLQGLEAFTWQHSPVFFVLRGTWDVHPVKNISVIHNCCICLEFLLCRSDALACSYTR